METATLTRPAPGTGVSARQIAVRSWPAVALGALVIATLVGFLVYPTFPNYDSYYSLLWGRELLHGITPTFEVYRAPTEHPLAMAFGALMSLLGGASDRTMVAFTLVSFILLAVGLYRLGRAAFTPLVGLVAAGLVCTRFDFPFLAARAYIDIPYLAMVVWAAALEAERPRRGTPVLILLAAASLMRPEAWLLIGLYFLWVAVPADWNRRLRYAALTAAGPLIWVAIDYAVTGKPLFSLKHTSGLAEELGRTKGLSQVPHATVQFLVQLDKIPVLIGAGVGLALAVLLAPRRVILPLLLGVIGVGTFFMVGVAGLSVIDRYLLVPSLMVMIFAGVAVGGWTMLREGTRLRRAWALGAAALVIYGVVFTATRVNLSQFDRNLTLRGDSHVALVHLLRNDVVRRALRCGPLSVPNHKLIPEARWVLRSGPKSVIARSDPAQRAHIGRGVAVYITNRDLVLLQQVISTAGTDAQYSDLMLNPLPGFRPIAHQGLYSAYVRC